MKTKMLQIILLSLLTFAMSWDVFAQNQAMAKEVACSPVQTKQVQERVQRFFAARDEFLLNTDDKKLKKQYTDFFPPSKRDLMAASDLVTEAQIRLQGAKSTRNEISDVKCVRTGKNPSSATATLLRTHTLHSGSIRTYKLSVQLKFVGANLAITEWSTKTQQ